MWKPVSRPLGTGPWPSGGRQRATDTGLASSVANYDRSPDGDTFLMIEWQNTGGESRLPGIVVVQSWLTALERLAPTN